MMRFKEIYRNSRVHWRCAHEGIMSCQIYDDAVEGESFFFLPLRFVFYPASFLAFGWVSESRSRAERARARSV